ncbi:MAG TPA: EAL domain-containing protein [Candidatus Bathyarchaeia archaeon]|nr:EAL domain-containing protein [Candidatus Bathyarchaeia archaeon]
MENAINQKRHILLVDDEKHLTDMLSMLLETKGYSVDVASTAVEALQKVSPNHDLIILDLVLPDLDGMEICRRLKQEERTAHIPIIMLSAHSMYEDKVEGLYLGADDFLIKPCEHEELFARMEAVIRRSKSNGKIHLNGEDEVVVDLRRVLDESLIVPHFQPIYQLDPFSLYGLEVLSRPTIEGNLSNPEIFFKAALQYGLYTELEVMSWSMALERLSRSVYSEKIFLNCNPYFIETAKFERVHGIFEKFEIATKNVVLEITERSAISDFKMFYEQLQRYREYGFHFAVDDVGGGYASLESIVQTKPEVVKIDRHIVRDLHKDAFKRSIVRFIVSFCHENGIISVAEGIEAKNDLEAVCELGVTCGQGFYLFKPTAQVDLKNFLERPSA